LDRRRELIKKQILLMSIWRTRNIIKVKTKIGELTVNQANLKNY
jgi:hypothetical protein